MIDTRPNMPAAPPEPAAPPAAPAAGDDVVISVRGVGKMYRIYERPQDRLKQMLLWRLGRSYGREFWALRGVSFEVRRGESLGILGRNGSGKSTLLQIIAGTLAPSEGEVAVRGRVAALLELGSGFNPEFTGRENVFMNGAILGLSRAEMEARYDEIVAFADIGEFIDQPVKLYSSGMVVRLAFAVASCVDPDILIIDEALAVGDIAFQARCLDKIKRLTDGGATTLFVTHDVGTFQNLCDYGYLLERGAVFSHGRPAQIAMQYYELMREGEHARQRRAASPPEGSAQVDADLQHREEEIRGKTDQGEYRFGTGAARIIDYRITDADGGETMSLRVGELFRVSTVVEFYEQVDNLALGVMFRNAQGQNLFGVHTYHEHRVNFGVRRPGERVEIVCAQEMLLNPGDYLLSISIADCRSDYDFTSLDSRSNLAKVSVFGKAIGYGLIHTVPRFEVSERGEGVSLLVRSAREVFSIQTIEQLKEIYQSILAQEPMRAAAQRVLSYAADTTPPSYADAEQEERAWPGERRFVESGYSQMMLGRYAFAGDWLCRQCDVLETGCGLGWGSYLIAQVARSVTALDVDPAAIEQCRELWPCDNVRWAVGDLRDLAPFGRGAYDVVLGMETIEHLSQPDGVRYVAEAAAALREEGVFVGTSAFPQSRAEAQALMATNPFHLHILTADEMLGLLRQHFRDATIIGGWMFIAVR